CLWNCLLTVSKTGFQAIIWLVKLNLVVVVVIVVRVRIRTRVIDRRKDEEEIRIASTIKSNDHHKRPVRPQTTIKKFSKRVIIIPEFGC
ncbi:hypothetical protein M8C21_014932, partial [Ambrosia artemisiifolia]